MTVQDQINAIAAQQGGSPTEHDLLNSPVVYHADASSGSNTCYRVELESGTTAFHKPFSGVRVTLAADYGHTDPDQLAIHEAAAWRLAAALGEPLSQLVCVCVLRTVNDEPGSLSLLVSGEPYGDDDDIGLLADQSSAAAFFDSLIAQQDRHGGNFLLDSSARQLGLIDHGFAFALPGHCLNGADLIQWRYEFGDPSLTAWERDALARLLSTDLLGLHAILPPDRADALADRARRMTDTDRILPIGAF